MSFVFKEVQADQDSFWIERSFQNVVRNKSSWGKKYLDWLKKTLHMALNQTYTGPKDVIANRLESSGSRSEWAFPEIYTFCVAYNGVMTCTMTGRFDVSSVKLMECKGPPHLSPGSSCPIRTSLLFLTASCLLLTTIIHRLLLSLNPSSVKKNPPVLMIILNFFFSTCHPLLSFLQDAVLTCFSLSKYEIKIYQHSHVDSSSTCHVFSYAKETSLYLWYLRKYRLGGTWSLDS